MGEKEWVPVNLIMRGAVLGGVLEEVRLHHTTFLLPGPSGEALRLHNIYAGRGQESGDQLDDFTIPYILSLLVDNHKSHLVLVVQLVLDDIQRDLISGVPVGLFPEILLLRVGCVGHRLTYRRPELVNERVEGDFSY